MRRSVGLLVAAAVGISCSAAAETVTGADPTEPAAPAQEGPAAPRPPEHAAPASTSTGDLPELQALIADARPRVTSTAVDPDSGAMFAAGTFTGTLAVGGAVLRSRGELDVFVLKLDRSAAIQWVRAVGGPWSDGAPRVSVDDARLYLIGMTKGELDCGRGPLQTWSSEMFFFCVFSSADGAPLAGAVFPTGDP